MAFKREYILIAFWASIVAAVYVSIYRWITEDDVYIHPLCMNEFFTSDNKEVFPLSECNARYESSPPTVTETSGSREYYWSKLNDGEGWIGVLVAEVDGDLAIVEVTENTGGTGQFSTIWWLESEDRFKTFSENGYSAFGDRCNDGYASLVKHEEDRDFVKTAATPFRLLNPRDRTDWRSMRFAKAILKYDGKADMDSLIAKYNLSEPLNGWMPYSDIDNSAASCVGWIEYLATTEKPYWRTAYVHIDQEFEQSLMALGEIGACTATWFESVKSKAESYDADTGVYRFYAASWSDALKQLHGLCPQGNGLKGWFESDQG